MKHNAFTDIPIHRQNEIFETLLEQDTFKLERIISRGQSTPPGQWLSQDSDEWVILLSGAAKLSFVDGREIALGPGDYLHIPAVTKHRVVWTDPQASTVWLALHYQAKPVVKPLDQAEKEVAIREVKIMRSPRRRKTVGARLAKGVLYVRAPRHISDQELDKVIKKFRLKFENKFRRDKANQVQDLKSLAEKFNRSFFYGKLRIHSIEYVINQSSKFGCCNFRRGTIRLSHRLAQMPEWVRDYVIIHELVHLVEPNHSKAFWELLAQYKFTERAKGYLMAKGMEEDLD